jgi:hypothetical protein
MSDAGRADELQRRRHVLGRQLFRRRRERGKSQDVLAAALPCDRSMLSRVENHGAIPENRRFWEQVDTELRAGGELLAAFDALIRFQDGIDDDVPPAADHGRRLTLVTAAAPLPTRVDRVLPGLDADQALSESDATNGITKNDQDTNAAITSTTAMPATEHPSTSDPSAVLGAQTDSSDAVCGSTEVAIRKAGEYLADSTSVGGAAFAASLTVCAPIPSRIGWSEVEQVRAATSALAASENLFGGGLTCEAAAGQLRWAARLLDVGTQDATGVD